MRRSVMPLPRVSTKMSPGSMRRVLRTSAPGASATTMVAAASARTSRSLARLEQQHRRRRAVEDARSAADRSIVVRAATDVDTTLEHDERDFVVIRWARKGHPGIEAILTESDVLPASMVWADVVDQSGVGLWWPGLAMQVLSDRR